jgi:cytochrome c-type biogenesis protein CcmH
MTSRHTPARAPAEAGAQFGRFAGLLLSQEHKWLAVLATLFGLLAAAPALADSSLPPAALADTQLADPRQERQARTLMEEIRCLVCQGQSIADSDAEMAGDMRALIRTRIQRGESPEAIRAWLIARYGNWVSYDPPFEPVTWPLWALPVLLILAGLWLARGRFKRRGRAR